MKDCPRNLKGQHQNQEGERKKKKRQSVSN